MRDQDEKKGSGKNSFDEIENRLDRLGKKLDKVRKVSSDSASASASIARSHSQMGKAFRITSELVGPVLVSVFIGYWLDRYFEIKPAMVIIFFILGVVTGFMNVIRAAKKMQQEAIDSGACKEARDMPFDDDDD